MALPLRSLRGVLSIGILASMAGFFPAGAQTANEHLVVGTKEAPPFVMRGDDGLWTGISIELWQAIAVELGVDYELREYDLEGLMRALETGQVDAGVAAVTVTGERELAMDFSHPYYTTGFGIAVASRGAAARVVAREQLATSTFAGSLLAVVGLVLVIGLLIWWVERGEKRRPSLASALAMAAPGSGVGPQTAAGRLFAVAGAVGSVVIIGSFFAGMAAELTAKRLEVGVRGPDDLQGVRVGTVTGSTSERYLRGRGIAFESFPRLEAALDEVADGTVEAVVYDAPLLQYLAADRPDVSVVPQAFETQSYSIALPATSPLRERLNRALLSDRVRAERADILYRYLGEGPAPPVKPPVPAEN